MAESQLNSSSSSSSWRRVSSHPSPSDRDAFFQRDRPRSSYLPSARENPDRYRDPHKMNDSRDHVAGSSRVSDRLRAPPEKSRPSVSSSDESLGRSPQENNSSEKEPGELSSGSIPEDSNTGAEEVKSSRVPSSAKQEAASAEKDVTHERSSSPVQKKRKFTPIVWDLDDRPSQQKGPSAITTFSKKSTTVKLQSRLQLATAATSSPLPVPSSPPHPPPPSSSFSKKQDPTHRSSLVSNVSRGTPPKSSSRMNFTPPNNGPQSSVAKALSLSGSISASVVLRTSGSTMVTSRGSCTPSPPPNDAQVSPLHVESNAVRGEEDTQKGNDISRNPDDSEKHIPMEPKDVEMDMGPVPNINIATSRWAEENTPSWDENLSSGTGKEKVHQSLSMDSDDGGHLSTDEERGRYVGEDDMSPEPGEYIRDKPESGDTGGINTMKEYDAQMPDQYDKDLNNRELMDIDKEEDRDSEEEERPDEVDSEEEEEETPVVPLQPQRAIDMLQGCRSVDEFERLNKIDEGTYGVVYRARDKKTGEIVALKKVKMEKEREGFPMTSLREINVLLSIHHPSIVDVKEVVVGSNLDSIFMVMEYMEHDLKGLMETIKQPFSQSEVKCLMLQLFEGVKHLHDNWVLHRDLKTSNLLLNNRGELKICDFGLARQYGSPLKTYTHMVVTLWYRAPELLLGCKQYSTAVDMWSLGCIMAEFLAKEPLFNGKNELDQLDKIFKTLGTPNETIWPDFPKLPGVKCNFVKQPFNKLREKFPPTAFAGRPPLSESGFNLLNRLLLYDPKKRITAEEALNHDWFNEVPLPKMKELMPTYPARSEQERRSRRLMKSPDPLLEQRKRELRQAELGSGGLFG